MSVNITSLEQVIKLMMIIIVTPIAKVIGVTDAIFKKFLDPYHDPDHHQYRLG